MNRSFVAAVLTALALTACGKSEAPTAPTPAPATGSDAGAQTPPGAATEPAGNKASENATDAVPTQGQLNPTPAENKPAQ